MNRSPFLLSLLFLASCGGGCGGSGPASPPASAVGGGLADGPGGAPGTATPPSPAPAPATTLPGLWFGVSNQTDSDIVSYAWWETRANVPPPFPGQHWFNLVPLGTGVAPGQERTLPVGEDGRPWYEPAPGALIVRAYLRDGRVLEATIPYAPPASAIWIVR